MHAVVIEVDLQDREAAQRGLEADVIPQVKQAPGFVTGLWVEVGEGQGLSVVAFESEDHAKAMADMVRRVAPSAVSFRSIKTARVVGHA